MILELLKSTGGPFLAIMVLFFISGGLKDPVRSGIQALVFVAAFIAGNFFVVDHLQFPPVQVGDAFAWSAVTLMIFVWINPRSPGTRYLIRALFVIAVGALVLWPIRESLMGPVNLRNLLAFFCLGLGTWSIVERCSQKVKPLTLITLPLIASVALAFLLVANGGRLLLQQVTLLAALLAGLWAVAVIAPSRLSAAAIMPFISIFVVAFMVAAHFYLHINPWYMVYLCVPFFLLWLRDWVPFIPHQPRVEAFIFGLLALIPLLYFLWNFYRTPIHLF